MQHLVRARVLYQAAITIGMLAIHLVNSPLALIAKQTMVYLCAKNGAESLVFSVEAHHCIQRKRAAHVSVQDKEAVGLSPENFIPEMIQTTCCAQCLVFT
jgi:hypothetical protein